MFGEKEVACDYREGCNLCVERGMHSMFGKRDSSCIWRGLSPMLGEREVA